MEKEKKTTSDVYICYHTDDEPVVARIKEALTAAGITYKSSPVSPKYQDPLEMSRLKKFYLKLTRQMYWDTWHDATPLLPPEHKKDIDDCLIFMLLNTRKCYNSRVVVGEMEYATRTKKKELFVTVLLEQGKVWNCLMHNNCIIYTTKSYVIEWLPEVVEKEVIPKLKKIISNVEQENKPPTGPCAEAYTLYRQGRYEEAFRLYLELGEQGNAEAQYNLGAMCLRGLGTEVDGDAAVQWYTKAVGQGIVQAAFNLAGMYYHGQHVAVDKEKAAKYYRSCAEADYMPAQYCLSVMLYKGDGIEEDQQQGKEWYMKAVSNGCNYAPPYLFDAAVL